jgi:Tfp pilus assembly protein PilV
MIKIRGQSLFEVVIAVSAAALITVALVSLGTRSLGSSIASKNKSAASTHVEETTEWLRSERDANWTTFRTNVARCTGSPACLSTLTPTNWNISCGPCGGAVVDNLFTREITFTCQQVVDRTNLLGNPISCSSTSVNKVSVTVNVAWSDSGGTHAASADTSYTNWQGGGFP